MNRAVARILTRLYPRTWRERYGAEFEALLERDDGGFRVLANTICSAIVNRCSQRKEEI
jgi:hypothetical protein